jgi:putative lipoprotein
MIRSLLLGATVTLSCLLALGLAACTTHSASEAVSAGAQAIEIQGKISYRERIAMPPRSRARIVLEAASTGRQAVIAKTDFAIGKRQVPIPFTVSVPADKLRAGRDYTLHAAIVDPANKPLWSLDKPLELDASRASRNVGTLWLIQTMAPASGTSATAGTAPSVLAGAVWHILTVNGKSPVENSRPILHFDKTGRVTGRTGCNSLSGRYEIDGQGIHIDHVAVTLKACSPALNRQERSFLDILNHSRRFDIDRQGRLTLHAGDKTLSATRE